MSRLILPLAATALLLLACGEQPEPPAERMTGPASGPPAEPVVVYASYDDANYLPQFFAGFTHETGIRVTVRNRDPKVNIDDVINDRGSPSADLLLAPDVHGLWRAADEGALRPLRDDRINSLVDERLRDPDGQWVALSFRTAVIAYDPDAIGGAAIGGYESLADAAYKDKLCVTSSELSVNRSLIAMLIDAEGIRPAEIIVRGWMANLLLPPFESEAALLDALDAGTCAVTIVSSAAVLSRYAEAGDAAPAIYTPDPAFADVEGIALVRHAKQAESATLFIAWLLADERQREHAASTATMPANLAAADDGIFTPYIEALAERNVNVAGWRDEDARALAQRARYR